jgi:hypothetical protein
MMLVYINAIAMSSIITKVGIKSYAGKGRKKEEILTQAGVIL